MVSFVCELIIAISIGIGIFVLFQLLIRKLPDCYEEDREERSRLEQLQQGYHGWEGKKSEEPGVFRRNFDLGSATVETWRREVALRAVLRRACARYVAKRGVTAGEQPAQLADPDAPAAAGVQQQQAQHQQETNPLGNDRGKEFQQVPSSQLRSFDIEPGSDFAKKQDKKSPFVSLVQKLQAGSNSSAQSSDVRASADNNRASQSNLAAAGTGTAAARPHQQASLLAYLPDCCNCLLGLSRPSLAHTLQKQISNAVAVLADHVAAALEGGGIVTKEHMLQLASQGGILEQVLAEAVEFGQLKVLQADTYVFKLKTFFSGPDFVPPMTTTAASQPGSLSAAEAEAAADATAAKARRKNNIEALARALVVEAGRPLPRTNDPKVLMRGVSTLITLNVFLASAVFIGLSLTAPDGVTSTLQTAYCDLNQQLDNITARITSFGNTTETRKWQAVLERRSSLVNCSNAGHAFPDPGPWGQCSGNDSKKPVLMGQQISAFVLFLGSTGIAFGLLLSVQQEGEMNEGWERAVTWVPYFFSGFATMLGLVFLLMSLITMGEVQYGPWQNWHGCNLPWLPVLAWCFVGFEAFCALVGIAAFVNGWKIL